MCRSTCWPRSDRGESSGWPWQGQRGATAAAPDHGGLSSQQTEDTRGERTVTWSDQTCPASHQVSPEVSPEVCCDRRIQICSCYCPYRSFCSQALQITFKPQMDTMFWCLVPIFLFIMSMFNNGLQNALHEPQKYCIVQCENQIQQSGVSSTCLQPTDGGSERISIEYLNPPRVGHVQAELCN